MSIKAAGIHSNKQYYISGTEAEVTGVVGKVLELGLVSSFAVAALKVSKIKLMRRLMVSSEDLMRELMVSKQGWIMSKKAG
ncbi:1472_t:CDS:2 [Paraglomus occultum]|uniref:1472_t:CDS:1 n=1 Tax=Paraglomus occultum TaxID=144539 RepID=A0A9N9CLZ1_9GLOM|nr:1472_t:CDS:2 [Paraglomus occultum]